MQKKTKNNISIKKRKKRKKKKRHANWEDNKEYNFKYDRIHKKNLYGQPKLIC